MIEKLLEKTEALRREEFVTWDMIRDYLKPDADKIGFEIMAICQPDYYALMVGYFAEQKRLYLLDDSSRSGEFGRISGFAHVEGKKYPIMQVVEGFPNGQHPCAEGIVDEQEFAAIKRDPMMFSYIGLEQAKTPGNHLDAMVAIFDYLRQLETEGMPYRLLSVVEGFPRGIVFGSTLA